MMGAMGGRDCACSGSDEDDAEDEEDEEAAVEAAELANADAMAGGIGMG
jgi:hypothetical protein